MAKRCKISHNLVKVLKEKATQSPCTYRISGVAYSKKGNVLGYCTNNHSKWNVLDKIPEGRAGTAEHCERRLISKYGNRIHTIIICRVGNSGELRKIDPCKNCAKLAAKYGITIKTIS